jgi:hypothetical protein
MRKQFIITSVFALAMGLAQAQTQPTTPAPAQSGTGDQRQGVQQPIAPAAAQGMGTAAGTQEAAQSFKGCLNGSSGSWTLISDKGKSMNLSGTDDQLSPYKGEEVRIQGVQSSDGSITVSSVDKVSDACANPSASNSATSQSDMNNQASTSTTTSTAQSATTTQPSNSDNMNQSSTQAPATTPDNANATSSQSSTDNNAVSSQSSSTTTTPGATTPPVTNQTPANTVGSGQTGQSNAQSTTTTSDQSSNNQNANQGIHQYSDMDQNAGNTANKGLPQTASPLPLLGLIGFGSLAAGLLGRRKK